MNKQELINSWEKISKNLREDISGNTMIDARLQTTADVYDSCIEDLKQCEE